MENFRFCGMFLPIDGMKGDCTEMVRISKIIHGAFAVVFLLTIATCIARGYVKYNALMITASLILGAAFTVLAIWMYGFLKKRTASLTESQIDRIFIVIALCVLIFQIVALIFLKSEPVNDLSYVNTAAKNFCKTWDRNDLYIGFPSRHYGYFARYPNNNALLIILSLIYAATDQVFGVMPDIVPAIINTAGLNISFWLMYLISKKVSEDKFTSLYCAMFGALFTVFYTYTPFYYTDSMSMPFAMLACWLFLKSLDCKKVFSTVALMALSSICIVVGYKIKGSVIILVPAFLIYLIFILKKAELKMFFARLLSLLIAVVLAAVAVSGFINSFNLTEKDEYYYREFPLIHWVMMGLYDRGGYYDQDFWYTESQGDVNQKTEADIYMIKKRLSDYGVSGFAGHIAKKASYTWADGTYSIIKFLKHGDNNFIRHFVTKSYGFKGWCTIYQFCLLFMILASFIFGAGSQSRSKAVLLRIILIGVYVFFLLWEARSRYLVNFSPLFIVLAADSFKNINSFLQDRAKMRKSCRNQS